MSLPAPPDAKNYRLEILRGLLALAVFLSHLRSVFFVDHPTLHAPNLPLSLFYFLTSLGRECVLVFFVLSGYLVGGAVIQSMMIRKRWSWKQYLLRRLVRLWVVLVPALLFGYCIDRAGVSFFPETPRYRQSPLLFSDSEISRLSNVETHSVELGSDVGTYLGNLFFLQTIVTRTTGSNGPLWSLASEFWYYLLFPLLLIPFMTNASLVSRASGLLLGVILLWWLPPSITGAFLVWLMGAALAWLEMGLQSRLYLPLWTRVGVGCIGTGLAMLSIRIASANLLSAFGGLMMCYACLAPPIASVSGPRALRFVALSGKISYSLYLCHMPVVCFLAASVVPMNRALPALGSFGLYFLMASGIYAYAIIFYLISEHHTERLRNFIAKVMLPKQESGEEATTRRAA